MHDEDSLVNEHLDTDFDDEFEDDFDDEFVDAEATLVVTRTGHQGIYRVSPATGIPMLFAELRQLAPDPDQPIPVDFAWCEEQGLVVTYRGPTDLASIP